MSTVVRNSINLTHLEKLERFFQNRGSTTTDQSSECRLTGKVRALASRVGKEVKDRANEGLKTAYRTELDQMNIAEIVPESS